MEKVAGVSQRLADFGFQKASKPKPTASKSAKGKEKENAKDPTQVFDGMPSKLSKLKFVQGPPSRHILDPDGLPISSMSMSELYTFRCLLFVFVVASKQKVATRSQSILDAVSTKGFSAPPFKPAGGSVFKPIINAALRPDSNDVLKHVGNGGQLGNRDVLAFGGATVTSKALATALDNSDINMGDAPTSLPTGGDIAQPQDLGCNPSLPPSVPPSTSSPASSIGRVLFIS